jgi:hypothetical protein
MCPQHCLPTIHTVHDLSQCGAIANRIYEHEIDCMTKAQDVTNCSHCLILWRFESSTRSQRFSRQIINDDSTDNKLIRELWKNRVFKKDRILITGEISRVNHVGDKRWSFRMGIGDQDISRMKCLNRSRVAY